MNSGLTFSAIPEQYRDALLTIESRSNPLPWSSSSLHSGYYQFEHIGAFQSQTLIAFIIYRQYADEAEIIHVVCDEPYQGKGHTKELFQQLIRQFKQSGVRKIFLEVRPSNHKARMLYQRLGFKEMARRKAYYQNNEDAIIMQLLIPNI